MEIAYQTNFASEPLAFGHCDTPAGPANFDGAAYMGTWFEQQHVKNQAFQDDSTVCVTAQYEDLTADGHFKVRNEYQEADFGPRQGITGKGYCPTPDGVCFVNFFVEPLKSNYRVVDTDYKTYSVVYACGIKQYLWLLTREPVVSDETYNMMINIAKDNLPHFDWSNMNTRDYQGDKCTYPITGEFLQ
jgi:lipocalin